MTNRQESNARKAPSRPARRWLSSSIGTLILLAGCYQQGPTASGSPSESEVATPGPSASVSPTHWVLQAIHLPPPHENGTVLATSTDAQQVAFLDEPTGKELFVLRNGQAAQVHWPGEAADAVPAAAFAPDDSWLLVWQVGNLWRLNRDTLTAVRLPDPPEGPDQIAWFAFLSDGRLAVSVWGSAPNGADARLYRLDVAAESFTRFGTMEGVSYFFATEGGGVAVVSDRLDASPVQILTMDADGTATLLTTLDDADSAVVSPDGNHVAYRNGGDTFLLDVSTGETIQLPDGAVGSFAPDASAVALKPPAGNTTIAVDMRGHTILTVGSASTAWVALR